MFISIVRKLLYIISGGFTVVIITAAASTGALAGIAGISSINLNVISDSGIMDEIVNDNRSCEKFAKAQGIAADLGFNLTVEQY